MTTTYLGGLSVGGACPGAAAGIAAGIAGINGALPDLQARLAALQAFSPTPIDPAASLLLAQQTLQSVQLAISLGLPVPDLSAQIAIVSAQIAALLAVVSMVDAQLDLLLELEGALAAAGLHSYAYTGTAGNLGAEIGAETSGGLPGGAAGDAVQALLIATSSPAAFAALSQLLKTS